MAQAKRYRVVRRPEGNEGYLYEIQGLYGKQWQFYSDTSDEFKAIDLCRRLNDEGDEVIYP